MNIKIQEALLSGVCGYRFAVDIICCVCASVVGKLRAVLTLQYIVCMADRLPETFQRLVGAVSLSGDWVAATNNVTNPYNMRALTLVHFKSKLRKDF